MLFNSYQFWMFLAVVIGLYRLIGNDRVRMQNRMLLVASYVFYGSWDWRFLSLILTSTVVDYFVALKLVDSTGKKRQGWLWLSMSVNLGLLGAFKYFGFFVDEFQSFMHALGINLTISSLAIVLPVGISFYTFQTMSYTIDVYRGVTRPIRSILDFALYVAFFPQLVAGPIERSSRLIPQIIHRREHRPSDFRDGLYLVVLGMFKKVVIADNMAVIANAYFNTPVQQQTGFESLVAVYAFAFQIYGDFSGYSAIARGVAKWMGFDLMVNFRMPYFAVSPSDFWNRWHISLSTWLRDYLYIPLGGNRGGRFLTYRNIMLTMLLGGLWHGAAWTFIAWGAVHGILLIGFRIAALRWQVDGPGRSAVVNIAMGLVMFNLVCITWLLFRAHDITQAWQMFQNIVMNFHVTALGVTSLALIVFYTGPLMVYEYWLEQCGDLGRLLRCRWPVRAVAYSYAILMLILFQPSVHSEFIYFRF